MRLLKYKFYFKEYLYRNVDGKTAIAFFIPAYTIYLLMLLITIPKVIGFTGGMEIFDSIPFGYTVDYAKTLLDNLGVEGRNSYLYQQIPLDLIFPFLSGIANCLILTFVLNKLNSLKTPYIYLCTLPLLAALFDYFENLGVIGMLFGYPHISGLLVHITSFFTVLKSLLSTIFFVVLAFALVVFLFTRFSGLLRKPPVGK